MFLELNTLNEAREQPLSAAGLVKSPETRSRMQDANEKPLDYAGCPGIPNRCRLSPSHCSPGKEAQSSISTCNYAPILTLLLREHELYCAARHRFSFYCTSQGAFHQEDEKVQHPKLSAFPLRNLVGLLNHGRSSAPDTFPLWGFQIFPLPLLSGYLGAVTLIRAI